MPPGATLLIGVEGATGIVTGLWVSGGTATGLGAICGAVGTEGIVTAPLFPEGLGASLFRTSLGFGMSFGGFVGVGGATGAPGVAQGLATVAQPQDFLQPRALILSNRLGR